MFAQSALHDSEERTEPKLSFLEGELDAYRTENARLAKELEVARRVIGALPFTNRESPLVQVVAASRLPGAAPTGDDVLFHIDHCEPGDRLIHVAGWAFSPRINCQEAVTYLLLTGPEKPLFAPLGRISRPDVATAFANVDLGPNLPPGSPGRLQLSESGFAVLIERTSLAPAQVYGLVLQIEGPNFVVRKATGVTFHC